MKIKKGIAEFIVFYILTCCVIAGGIMMAYSYMIREWG